MLDLDPPLLSLDRIGEEGDKFRHLTWRVAVLPPWDDDRRGGLQCLCDVCVWALHGMPHTLFLRSFFLRLIL